MKNLEKLYKSIMINYIFIQIICKKTPNNLEIMQNICNYYKKQKQNFQK
jgi:hypothetical protein